METAQYVIREKPTNKYLRLYNSYGVYNPEQATKLTKEAALEVMQTVHKGDGSTKFNLEIVDLVLAKEDYIKFGREELAACQHKLWATWVTNNLFCQHSKNKDGSITIPNKVVREWEELICNSNYINLPESVKELNRNRADEVIQVLYFIYEPNNNLSES